MNMTTPPELSAPFQPDWVSKPGNTIKDILEQKGMGVCEACLLMGYSCAAFHLVIDAKLPIDDDLAGRLSAVLGASKQFWINRQARYDADVIRLGKGPLPYEPPFAIDEDDEKRKETRRRVLAELAAKARPGGCC